jgi:Pyridine nucleotide-disulphide oxidoreductase
MRSIAVLLLIVDSVCILAPLELDAFVIRPSGLAATFHAVSARSSSRGSTLLRSAPTKDDTKRTVSSQNDTLPDPEMATADKVLVKVKQEADAPANLARTVPSTSLMLDPEKELDGEAKVEEPGDRDKISYLVRKFQYSIWKEEPAFPIDTIWGRTLDTAEDAWLHARRVPYDYGWVQEPARDRDTRPTVVILGSGWAAHAFLKVADTYKLRIIVVSPSNHFVFTPMLASASVGTVEYRSMTEAVRAANPMIENYLEGTATDIDVQNQVLTVKLVSLLDDLREGDPPTIQVQYDKLICAVGCKVADSMVKGAYENSLRLKTCDDARRLRTAVGETFEYASRPDVKDAPNLADIERDLRREERRKRLTFAIVGGGPTGVELYVVRTSYQMLNGCL